MIAALVRALVIGYLGVRVGLHLAARGLDDDAIGAVVAAGLTGAALAALAVTVIGDRISRRRWLVGLGALGALGTAALALAPSPWLAAAAAFVGMVNGAGRDRGAALVLEQAALPATTDDAGRTRVFAIYALAQDIGHAGGAALAAVPIALATGIGACAAASALLLPLYATLSPAVDATTARPPPLRPETRRTVGRISALFALDSIGGGFLAGAMLAVFFTRRFDAGADTLAFLFAASRVLNAASHLGAAWLARRIGLVRTMVFTHLPSSLLLVTVAFAPSLPVAAALFLLREGLVEMDVPTRSSFVMAVVAPEERTRAAGVTHLVRLAGWAVGPLVAGALMTGAGLWVPLAIAAALKIAYDLLLWAAFRSVTVR